MSWEERDALPMAPHHFTKKIGSLAYAFSALCAFAYSLHVVVFICADLLSHAVRRDIEQYRFALAYMFCSLLRICLSKVFFAGDSRFRVTKVMSMALLLVAFSLA